MMQQADDFLEESNSLFAIVSPLNDEQLLIVTQFKKWTIEDIIGHLHIFNHAAKLALESSEAFNAFFAPMVNDLAVGKSLLDFQRDWLGKVKGRELVEVWRAGYEDIAAIYGNADPKQRITWVGPPMSARSSITARQMETWAHGQAVFDTLGLEREDSDRIKNIVHMGVGTYGWTFINRKWEVPDPAPYVELTAPSGEVWQWNEEQDDNCVSGLATEFCQIVTQTRNVADTNITTVGEAASRWMANAQCFAGQPHDAPKVGTRFKV